MDLVPREMSTHASPSSSESPSSARLDFVALEPLFAGGDGERLRSTDPSESEPPPARSKRSASKSAIVSWSRSRLFPAMHNRLRCGRKEGFNGERPTLDARCPAANSFRLVLEMQGRITVEEKRLLRRGLKEMEANEKGMKRVRGFQGQGRGESTWLLGG